MAQPPMRVAITLEQCWHRVPGGTAASVLGLVAELDRRPDLRLLGVAARHRHPPEPPFVPPIPVRPLPLPERVLYEAWHGLRWPPVERATGPIELIHATAVAVPPATVPVVVTVHDLAFLTDRRLATRHGHRFFRRGLDLARREATLVLCPSAATRRECVDAGLDPGRLRVVPWGVRPTTVEEPDRRSVLDRFGLDRRFVLFCGTVEPRKNLAGLLDGFGRVAGAHPDVDLVLVGPAGWNEDLAARIGKAGVADRVRALGFVDEEAKQALYASAAAVCYPSHREGFGLPVLEAMAQGAPVVTSAGTATEEAAGGAALLIDPGDPSTIADALDRVLGDDALAADLAQRGRRRAADLSWPRSAELTVDAYREALDDPRRRRAPGRTSGSPGAADRPPGRRTEGPADIEAGGRGGGGGGRGGGGGDRRHVGVNLLWLVPGTVGGSEEYLTRLLSGIAASPPDDLDLTLFVLEPFLDAHPDLVEAFPTVTWPATGRSKALRIAAESTWLPDRLRRHHVDLVHHGGGVVPPGARTPSVLTIHDLQPLVLPDNFRTLKRRYLAAMLPRSAARARLVLTPSDHAGRSVVEVLGVPPERVRTVPHGVEATAPPTAEQIEAGREVARRRGVAGPYFVLPGIPYAHKNHVGLVQAFARVAAVRPDAQLVLPGGEGPTDPDLAAEVERAGLRDRVHRLGRVPRSDLDALLDGACALTFPSRYEGFGAPVLEAMARGCPVVAASATALPEVVGEGGLLLAPDDVGGWAAAMIDLLDHPDRRRALSRAGLERARTFTWHRSAEILLDCYRDALAVRVPAR